MKNVFLMVLATGLLSQGSSLLYADDYENKKFTTKTDDDYKWRTTSEKSNETTTEKIGSKARDAKRGVKKGVHRVQEAVCVKGDMECAADKAKHRATEAKDFTYDKTRDLKNKIDED